MKRIILFIGVNLGIVVMISLLATILGISGFVGKGGIDYTKLGLMSLLVGFTGSFISLAISKMMAKWTMGVKLINGSEGSMESWLLNTIEDQARTLKIAMPEVGIFDSDEMNAFATGPSKNNSLVALSTGLLRGMNKGEIQAVIAHEMSHVSNGDMVTMTLIQGVVNTFVFFIARIIAFAIDSFLNGDNDNHQPGLGYIIASTVLDLLLGILGSMVVAAHSRNREFAADKGAAELVGSNYMISALAKLAEVHGEPLPVNYRTMGISNPSKAGLFSTHPSIEERIQNLQR